MEHLRFYRKGHFAWRDYQVRRAGKQDALAGLDADPQLVVHDHLGPEVQPGLMNCARNIGH
jgi:hypothetical protein